MIEDLQRTPSLLQTQILGRSFEAVESTPSTMDDMRIAMEQGAPHGHIIVADSQTSGRGTHGRIWESPSGTDLYFSIGLKPKIDLAQLGILTLVTGFAVSESIDHILKLPLTLIKWPNDILIHHKKVSGILVESRSIGKAIDSFIIGIGINCNRIIFPQALIDLATSLKKETHISISRELLLADLVNRLEIMINRIEHEGPAWVIHALQSKLAWVGHEIRINQTQGYIKGITERGGLSLTTLKGDVEVLAGQIERL